MLTREAFLLSGGVMELCGIATAVRELEATVTLW